MRFVYLAAITVEAYVTIRYHYLSTNGPIIAVFNSTLINGAGRWAGGPATPLSVVNVQQGKR